MKRYVLVGLGGRSEMFTESLPGEFKASASLVGICDSNSGRLEKRAAKLKQVSCTPACYLSKDFDRMLKEQKPDCVIVCTMDSVHDDYICRALEAGCDAITEKPMTINEQKCQRIIDTAKRTGKNVRVTFNYRYAPPRSQVKEILMSGAIGKLLSVEFQYQLDTRHGADYFRRWHRNKKNSGGLLVHKATHHFDLINWWLSDVPVSVFAQGDRLFYNEKQAKRYGLEHHGERCRECLVKDTCNYYLDMAAFPSMVDLYLSNEDYDGYYRDRCIFSDEIDIEDSMNVAVCYKGGAMLSYSLSAFSPWEGYHLAINGTKGRLEHGCQETSYMNGDGTVQGGFQAEKTYIRVFTHFKTPYSVPPRTGQGGHGGGDIVMLTDIFGRSAPDLLKRSANYIQGAYSLLIGAAANKSIATGQRIKIDSLVHGLSAPDFLTMLGEDEDIPYVDDCQCINSEGEVIQANL